MKIESPRYAGRNNLRTSAPSRTIWKNSGVSLCQCSSVLTGRPVSLDSSARLESPACLHCSEGVIPAPIRATERNTAFHPWTTRSAEWPPAPRGHCDLPAENIWLPFPFSYLTPATQWLRGWWWLDFYVFVREKAFTAIYVKPVPVFMV